MGGAISENILRSFRGTIAEYQVLEEDPLSLFVQYDTEYVHLDSFVEYCELMQDFLDSQELTGIAALEQLDIEQGQIQYTIQTTHSLNEIAVRSLQPFGAHAAVELLIACTDILHLAYYAAQFTGIESHANLSPDVI